MELELLKKQRYDESDDLSKENEVNPLSYIRNLFVYIILYIHTYIIAIIFSIIFKSVSFNFTPYVIV